MLCSQCGETLSSDDNFCPACGKSCAPSVVTDQHRKTSPNETDAVTTYSTTPKIMAGHLFSKQWLSSILIAALPAAFFISFLREAFGLTGALVHIGTYILGAWLVNGYRAKHPTYSTRRVFLYALLLATIIFLLALGARLLNMEYGEANVSPTLPVTETSSLPEDASTTDSRNELTNTPPIQNESTTRRSEEEVLSLREHCLRLGEQAYQGDVVMYGQQNVMEPTYAYNTRLQTCLYSGGYRDDGDASTGISVDPVFPNLKHNCDAEWERWVNDTIKKEKLLAIDNYNINCKWVRSSEELDQYEVEQKRLMQLEAL